MIIISPLTLKSTRSMLAMQKLQPQLKRLQAEHKNDRQAFAQAQMELFREHNVSPFGSCLPMLLPLPIFFALFEVINGLSRTINHVPVPEYLSSSTQMYKDIVSGHGHLNAFAMDLAKNPFSPHSGFMAALPYWVILVIMAGTSYLQSAQMMNRNPQAQSNPQMRLMKYLPLLFVVFCIRFPAGVILYYIVSNLCRIGQQYAMYRWDPKVRTLVAKEVIEVEEITRDIDERQKDRTNRPGYTPPRSVRAAGAGTGGGSRAGGGPKAGSGSGGGSGGRSRFRDLLAAAAEQQKTQQEAKEAARAAGGKGGGGNKALGSGGNQAGGTEGRNGRNGNGSAPSGRPAPTQSGGRPPGARNLPAGRSNRKKRGR
jgi:YidC/Oxa1 family membrane protein insertase